MKRIAAKGLQRKEHQTGGIRIGHRWDCCTSLLGLLRMCRAQTMAICNFFSDSTFSLSLAILLLLFASEFMTRTLYSPLHCSSFVHFALIIVDLLQSFHLCLYFILSRRHRRRRHRKRTKKRLFWIISLHEMKCRQLQSHRKMRQHMV